MACKVTYSLLALGVVATCLPLHDYPSLTLHPTAMTHAIVQRFYIIHRLERICARCFAMPLRAGVVGNLVQEILPLLRHERVYAATARAQVTGNLEPLQQLWQEIRVYRFLDDQLLIEEFTRMLYTLLTYYKTHLTPSGQPRAAGNKQHLLTDIPNIQDITQRFYLIQRLQHAVQVCKKKYHRLSADPDFMVMLSLWDDLQQYKHINTMTISFGICTSIIALLENHSTQEGPQRTVPSYTAIEAYLEYIDALTDRYQEQSYAASPL